MMGHQSLENNTAKYYINVIFHARHFYDYDEVLLKHYLIIGWKTQQTNFLTCFASLDFRAPILQFPLA